MKNKKLILSLLLISFIILNFSNITVFANNKNNNRVIPELKTSDNGVVKLDEDVMNIGKDSDGVWNQILDKYREVIIAFFAIATLTMIAIFIVSFVKLAATNGNPSERRNALRGLLFAGLGTLGLGSVTFIVASFYNIF